MHAPQSPTRITLLAIVFLLTLLPTTHAGVWYVNHANAGLQTGNSWGNAFTTIQEAVNFAHAAGGTQEIWIAKGTYTGTGHYVVELSPDIQLYGGFQGNETLRDHREWGKNKTVIDGEEERRVILGANNITVDGLTITNGNSLEDLNFPDEGDGAGVFLDNADAHFRNCHFTRNKIPDSFLISGTDITSSGGAIFAVSSDSTEITIDNCIFAYNVSDWGSAILASGNITVDVQESEFKNNIGSALRVKRRFADDTPYLTLHDSTFFNNQFTSAVLLNVTSGMDGGAVYFNSGTISKCRFIGNGAVRGAAVYTGQSHGSQYSTIEDSFFADNTASYRGGAIHGASVLIVRNEFLRNHADDGGAIYGTSVDIRNSLFAENSATRIGGAIAGLFYPESFFTSCTFYKNIAPNGGAVSQIDWTDTFQYRNCIFWDNSSDVYHESWPLPKVAFSILQDELPLSHEFENIHLPEGSHPVFVDPANYNFQLRHNSPAIDTGTFYLAPDDDLLGVPRPQLSGYDMGAYEYHPNQDSDLDGLTDPEEADANTNPYLADSDDDGISDSVELYHEASANNASSQPILYTVWVDFQHEGIEHATHENPVNTLLEALLIVSNPNATIYLKPGYGPEQNFIIDTPVTLNAPEGPVQIGTW